MPDPLFDEPRLAEIYDALDTDRRDLDAYVAAIQELSARSVLDVGCGTGVLACQLAAGGIEVTGVDPAAASLEVARRKPHAGDVTWVLGDATRLPADLQVDMATMTGNVAQAIVSDQDWSATLQGIRGALRPTGTLLFETRDPAQRAWTHWNREETYRQTAIPQVGTVTSWCELLKVSDELVSFRWTYVFAADAGVLTSDSTLRFRSRDLVTRTLSEAGFAVEQVRDAPDRPGLELVFVARVSR
ncbi:MAG: class I SAM-dependent methyltransferase [Nocardioidaceae bacterium]